jgi:methylmalonyl-CoA/ethylmalonyl-CoA epimerase
MMSRTEGIAMSISRRQIARHAAVGLLAALAATAPQLLLPLDPARADAVAGTAPVLDGVVQVSLVTHDLPRSIAFYRDVLGLDFLFETNGLAFFRAGKMSVMIGLSRNAEMVSGGGMAVYFDAPDWQAAERTLSTHGLSFDQPVEVVERTADREHVLHEFADPDGNRLAIMGWRPRTP